MAFGFFLQLFASHICIQVDIHSHLQCSLFHVLVLRKERPEGLAYAKRISDELTVNKPELKTVELPSGLISQLAHFSGVVLHCRKIKKLYGQF